jgi:NTP pyrophosphatase (non-canonical NTP hydrolase)
MYLSEYKTRVWDLFNPDIKKVPKNALLYLASKLSEEISEIWNISLEYTINNLSITDIAKQDEIAKNKLKDECGDVLWYIANLSNLLNIELEPNFIQSQYSTTSLISLTSLSGKLLGKILKRNFHNKSVDDDELRLIVNDIWKHYLEFINSEDILYNHSSLSDIMLHNINKLSQRHGSTYNKDFYQSQ